MAPTPKQPRFSMETLQRTVSDISFQLASNQDVIPTPPKQQQLQPIAEVAAEDAKCECCGMSEEFTPGYIKKVKDKFMGKMVCGLCAEAIERETEKNGGKREDAVKDHMSACVRFNKIGRVYPVLYQADAVREILKKKKNNGFLSGGKGGGGGGGGLARSSSCIPAIATRDLGAGGRVSNSRFLN
ncbi:hypothetical protein LINPERHAP1_LOCUS16706 [Linum perenne]